jgi:hypothetical protein
MRILLSVSIVFTFIGIFISTSSEVNASGTGCDNRQYFGETIDPKAISAEIRLPYGYLCHSVYTKGKEIKEQKAAYTSSAGIYAPLVDDICNWRIDFVYYDTNGDEYMRDKGETVSDCKVGASRNIEQSRKLPQYGTACAILMIEGEPRLTQCHAISE